MALSIRSVEYYYAVVQDQPGQAAELLQLLNADGVDLLAFSIVPTGPTHTQLMMFPSDPGKLLTTCKRAGMDLTGPNHALLVQGDNELGALVDVHRKLADADVNVYAATGVTDTKDGFGYLLYVKPEEFKKAAVAVGVVGAPSYKPAPPLKR